MEFGIDMTVTDKENINIGLLPNDTCKQWNTNQRGICKDQDGEIHFGATIM